MSTQTQVMAEPVTKEGNVFRATNAHKGRKVVVTPHNSSMQHLYYARTILDRGGNGVSFETGKRETGLIVVGGSAELRVNEEKISLGTYDAIYIPRNSQVSISSAAGCDIAEFAAEVDNDYPLQVVRYADLKQDKTLHFVTGSDATRRELNIMFGKNVKAGRIMAGLTLSEPGNWTSWPPHEHAVLAEELYVYTHMPPPAFGLQLVYTNTHEPELVTIVRDGDAVLMPRGYHPNVAAPGHRIGFLWAMAAHREVEDRQFGVVNVQPGFGAGGSGLDQARK